MTSRRSTGCAAGAVIAGFFGGFMAAVPAAPAPANAGETGCELGAFYGDIPDDITGNALIVTSKGDCAEALVARCEDEVFVIDYAKPGPDQPGLHPTETEDVACDDVRSLSVVTRGGDDRVRLGAMAEFDGIEPVGPETDDWPVRVDLGGGHDVLVGSPHDDEAWGGSGADRLRGERGTDVLIGGPAVDVLKGGPGQDCKIQGSSGSCAFLFPMGSRPLEVRRSQALR